MKINKNLKIIIGVIVIILVFVGGYYLRDYSDKEKRISGVNEYKKGFYEGMLCEYNCPMTPQEYKNVTQMLPDINCVKGCTGPFKIKFAGANYTKAEFENDNLLKDIDDAINFCKTHSVNMTSMTLNNTAYFNCAAKGLEELKQNYTYLQN